jgi:hypothetical protein
MIYDVGRILLLSLHTGPISILAKENLFLIFYQSLLGDIVKKTKEAKIIKTAVIEDVIAPERYEFSKGKYNLSFSRDVSVHVGPHCVRYRCHNR